MSYKHMKYDLELIQTLLTRYIRQNIGSFTWICDGKKVSVSEVESLSVLNVEEGDFGEDNNFHGSGRIKARVSPIEQTREVADSGFCISPYSFSCVFRVECDEQRNKKPMEKIHSIKEDRICLRKK